MTRRILSEFPSFQSLVDQAETGASTLPDSSRSSRKKDSHYFTWTPDYPTAVSLARHGWPEGTARAKVLTDATIDRLSPIIYRDDWQHCVEGGRGELDVARYLSGDPECIVAMVPTEDTSIHRSIHIVVNIAAMGQVLSESMALRGAAVASLAELLSMSGYKVKVTMVATSNGFHERWIHETRVVIKDYRESLDLARLVYAVAHPSTFRRHVFSIREQQDAAFRREFQVPESYGQSCDDVSDRGDIYIGRLALDWTPEQTAKWVLGELKKQGVKVEGTSND